MHLILVVLCIVVPTFLSGTTRLISMMVSCILVSLMLVMMRQELLLKSCLIGVMLVLTVMERGVFMLSVLASLGGCIRMVICLVLVAFVLGMALLISGVLQKAVLALSVWAVFMLLMMLFMVLIFNQALLFLVALLMMLFMVVIFNHVLLFFVSILVRLQKRLVSVMLRMALVFLGIFVTAFLPGPQGFLGMVLSLIVVILIVAHLPWVLIVMLVMLVMLMMLVILVLLLLLLQEDGLATHVPFVLHELHTRSRFCIEVLGHTMLVLMIMHECLEQCLDSLRRILDQRES